MADPRYSSILSSEGVSNLVYKALCAIRGAHFDYGSKE